MTVRHVGNQTSLGIRRSVISQTLENQIDLVARAENSPINIHVDTGADLVFKAHEWRPIGAAQQGTAPVFISAIPDIQLT